MSQVFDGNEHPDALGGARDDTPEKPRRWSDLSPRQKQIAVAAVLLNTVIASFTWRDLRRRPPELVRGPKMLWRLWSLANTTGSVAYWLVGRRRVPRGTTIVVT